MSIKTPQSVTMSTAAREQVLRRKLADARKYSRRGVVGFNYDSALRDQIQALAPELMRDSKWLGSSGTH